MSSITVNIELRIKNKDFTALIFGIILYSLFLIPSFAHAGLILGAPKYVGLNSGLAPLRSLRLLTGQVGYWFFDGPDMN